MPVYWLRWINISISGMRKTDSPSPMWICLQRTGISMELLQSMRISCWLTTRRYSGKQELKILRQHGRRLMRRQKDHESGYSDVWLWCPRFGVDRLVLPVLCMAGRRWSDKRKRGWNSGTDLYRSCSDQSSRILPEIKEWRRSSEWSDIKILWSRHKLWSRKNWYDALCRWLGIWSHHKRNWPWWYRTLPSSGRTFRKQTTAIGGDCWVINAKADQAKKDAAWEYIKYYTGKDYRASYYENLATKGAPNPVIIPRDDMSITDFYEFPEEYKEVLESANQ